MNLNTPCAVLRMAEVLVENTGGPEAPNRDQVWEVLVGSLLDLASTREGVTALQSLELGPEDGPRVLEETGKDSEVVALLCMAHTIHLMDEVTALKRKVGELQWVMMNRKGVTDG